MDSIITYLLLYNQYLVKTIYKLILFISKNIPLNQWAFDDSNSPEYQKFKVDKLPKIIRFEKVDYQFILAYYKHKYNKVLKPVQRRNGKSIPSEIICPKCGAPNEATEKLKNITNIDISVYFYRSFISRKFL
nr:hypothetical protein [Clostridium beijerinckii]